MGEEKYKVANHYDILLLVCCRDCGKVSFSHQRYGTDYTGCPFYHVPEHHLPWVLVHRKPVFTGNVEFIFTLQFTHR
jgi:hypothetical protein